MNYTYNLGDILYSHIKKSGYSIYEISKKANVSRSMLQKVLSNERKLTKNYLDKLKPYLKISPKEYLELIRMAEEIQKGTFEYRSYQMINELMVNVSESTAVHKDMSGGYMISSPNGRDEKEIYIGKTAVEGLLHEKIQREYGKPNPQLSVYIPGNSNLISKVLSQEALISDTCKNLTIKQIVCFARDKSFSETAWLNINVLGNVLPNIVVSKCKYNVFYYYGKELSDVRGDFGFPYYIIFSDLVMMLSADCSAALICTEGVVRDYFSNVFSGFLANTTPLVTACVKAEDILHHFITIDSAGHGLYSLECQPCFIEYMTEEIVYRYALKTIPFYDDATNGVIIRARQLRKLKLHTCYFSKTGLNIFAKEGIIFDFPPKYARPIDIQDRILFLETLYNDIFDDKQKHRMINPYTFPIPETLICVLHQDLGLHFYGFGVEKRNYNYIHIEEPSLLDIFCGYFQYLQNSMLVCTKEETLESIRECINQLL